MANEVNTEEKIIRVRSAKDSTDNWEKANPILLDGEIGIEMKPDGSIAIKVGDGKTAWKLLQYVTKTIKDADAEFQNLQNQLNNIVLASSDSGDVTAEVVQARVDVNGTNHPTLKDRLEADQNALAIEIGRVETDILSVKSKIDSSVMLADSVEWLKEQGDTEKAYVLPDGFIYGCVNCNVNRILTSIDADGTPYNGGLGYKTGYRLNSSGAEVVLDDAVVSGFIPYTGGDIEVRIPNAAISGGNNYLHLYNENFAVIAKDATGAAINGSYHLLYQWVEKYGATSKTEGNTLIISIPKESLDVEGVAYIRVSAAVSAEVTIDTFNLVVGGSIDINKPVVTEPIWDRIGSKSDLTGYVYTADSVEWLETQGDTQKAYILPDGNIYCYLNAKKWNEGCKNWVALSTVSGGGESYNETGYKLNVRLNSSAVEKDCTGGFVTGFIPVTKNSILCIKHFASGKHANFSQTGNAIVLYTAAYTMVGQKIGSVLKTDGIGIMDDTTGIYTVTVSDILDDNSIAYVRVSSIISGSPSVSATDDDANKVIITVDEEIADGFYSKAYQWANYSQVISEHEKRLEELEKGASYVPAESNGIPEYWLEHLAEKTNDIQIAVETAGRNKSAFLWYTDAHWTSSSKMSPLLLKYLAENTPINKVNFGGDIVGDPVPHTHENIKYVYEWRKMIAELPSHHSVYGNHDLNHRTTDVGKMAYAYILAPEESSEMVIGGDSYYYIDNPSEKTRYLYLTYLTNNATEKIAQGQFIVDAIMGVSEGWHIVVIAHRWWQYTSASAPTVGSIPAYESEILSIFDAYNARTTRASSASFSEQDFATAKGKVEFCIGGHIHVDYDFTSTGGIPVIITTADTNQNRVPDTEIDSGTTGTITESAVFGIIADYDNGKITVVGVGRGTSREITLTT